MLTGPRHEKVETNAKVTGIEVAEANERYGISTGFKVNLTFEEGKYAVFIKKGLEVVDIIYNAVRILNFSIGAEN